ncbi:MAG: cytochrome c, partial [Gammaproteobacteria bacterium]
AQWPHSSPWVRPAKAATTVTARRSTELPKGGPRLLLALALGTVAGLAQSADNPAAVERGRYLVHAGGCLTCHTADRPDAVPLAGGRAIKTAFGTFYPPNLTPDAATGLGNWTDADLSRALRGGVAPDGSYYYPVFPYPAYAGLADADVAAIGAYLRSLKPVHKVTAVHELPWYLSSRLVMLGWNFLNFTPGPYQPDPTRGKAWNRGAYLVRHLGHCGECHTPRNILGGLDHSREFAGNPAGPDGEKIPAITTDPKTGIGAWSVDELVLFLDMGVMPDGDFAGSAMSDVIDDNTSKLTPEDRLAIATYLESPARPSGEAR